jgi:hypothetical protein
MEIFLIKSGYHNEYHVENLASIFLIFTPTCGQVEILVAIWLHDANKKIAGCFSFLCNESSFICAKKQKNSP